MVNGYWQQNDGVFSWFVVIITMSDFMVVI